MPIIKSFDVVSQCGQDGDMFYIKHGSDNFTCIDCCLSDDTRDEIISEIKAVRKTRGIFRFISTHPDDDHICGIKDLNKEVPLDNFYCVKNEANNPKGETDFETYCQFRDNKEKAFYLYKGCQRHWMNLTNEEREGAGIHILWPDTDNKEFQDALKNSKDWDGVSINNLSPIIKYYVANSASFLWI
jgi:hypothetical protein